MCIIPGPIHSVNSTKIFVLPNEDKTRQLTFYRNSVSTPDENLMILPVPNIDSLKLETIKYKKMFDDLRSSVEFDGPRYIYRGGYSMERSLSASAAPLPVFDHGSYLVSIAPTIEDLARLDSEVFDIPPELDRFFRNHYTREFGYLCCVLKKGLMHYEPLAYSHAIQSNGRLFVPTLHFHNHSGRINTEHADWDHMIYSAGTKEGANYKFRSNAKNEVAWKKLPVEFRHSENYPIRCAQLEGNHKNRDLSFEVL